MDVIVIMCIGVLAGKFLLPCNLNRWNQILQVVCTLFLIFSMGVLLGSRENFLEELSTLGIQSVIFFLLPSVGSVLLVYPLTRRFLENKKDWKGEKIDMVYLAIIALLGGIACGMTGLDENVIVSWITSNKDMILYLLMFLVGISIGFNRGIVSKIKEYHIKIFVIPLGIVVGSILGGIAGGLLTGMPLGESTAIASGLGWYSLSGVTIGNLAGAQAGSIAFLSNLLREIFSFFSIPWISKKLNYYTCIAPAGATSEDTTLPMMIRYTNEETVVLSVFNGVICSALVPFLISFCYNIF